MLHSDLLDPPARARRSVDLPEPSLPQRRMLVPLVTLKSKSRRQAPEGKRSCTRVSSSTSTGLAEGSMSTWLTPGFKMI